MREEREEEKGGGWRGREVGEAQREGRRTLLAVNDVDFQ